jgi:hypothetical protein
MSAKLGKIVKSEEHWRGLLTPEQYRVARQAGTERPFAGPYWSEKRAGVYRLRRVRDAAVRIGHQTRVRHGLAQLHRSGSCRCRRGAERSRSRHAAHGSPLRGMRIPPWARLRWRSTAERAPLLRDRHCTEVRSRSRQLIGIGSAVVMQRRRNDVLRPGGKL